MVQNGKTLAKTRAIWPDRVGPKIERGSVQSCIMVRLLLTFVNNKSPGADGFTVGFEKNVVVER